MTWTRVEIPGAGRSLCDRRFPQTTISCLNHGYKVEMALGTICPSRIALPDALLAFGRTVPTDDDLAWLRGEQ